MSISYRKLSSADSAGYRDIRLESLKRHPESFGSSFEQQSKLPQLMFEKALEQPPDDRFVVGAFDQERLIGICGFIPFIHDNKHHLSHAGEIIQMYVKSEYSGRKIGLSLVKAVIAEAFKISDIQQIELGVKEGNMSAIRVYEQAGFQTYSPGGSETGIHKDSTRIMTIHRAG